MSFVHLHVHTEFSIEDSIVKINALIKKAVQLQQPAIAITDVHNIFGSLKFYQAAIKQGIKPIIGAEVRIQHSADDSTSSLILLCQNQTGYRHLTQLLSLSHLQSPHPHQPRIHADWLTGHTNGLIALLNGYQGKIYQSISKQQDTEVVEQINTWKTLFKDRLYIQLQQINKADEINVTHALTQAAQSTQTPVVATNSVCFLTKNDFETHEVKVCIQNNYTLNDPKRPKNHTDQQYLKSSQDMQNLFGHIPHALSNSVCVAQRCNYQFILDQHFLPNFILNKKQSVDEHCQQIIINRLHQYCHQKNLSDETKNIYTKRLDYEMDIIKSMGFTSYFLIVADFIEWSKKNGIPVGPGRGSGAGSLVAFMLKITGLDPIKHGLLFERFLNPERVSMPDFDIDFCMEGRDKVIDYVAAKYGKDCVSQIITYGTMAAKAVIRDVGRVMGHPYGFVDTLAKLVPFELGITLQKALLDEPHLQQRYNEEESVKTLIDMGIKLEGTIRNAGKHAGGVIIAPQPLNQFTALYSDADSNHPVTHLDKDDIEQIGLIKFDFLGLRTLTIIHWSIQQINANNQQNGKPDLHIEQIPLNDPATFSLLKSCQTTAVFQLESRGMKDLVKRLQPDSFEEIVALVALFRPGPLQSGMVDNYIERKHGHSEIGCFHELLIDILEPTYGVILYQEQVMKIAQVLANYSLGSADLLRRAMGKKKPDEMAKQREIFIEGAKQNNIDEKKSGFIFDIIEKFSGYGFNKSHSAAYSLIAYQTAYLKAHYPREYMAAVLSSDMDNVDKISTMIDECGRMKIKLLPPNINTSDYKFTVNHHAIQYSLGAIKGVGLAAIDTVIHDRKKNGAYTSLFDFCQRCDKQKVNRRVIDCIIKAGAMDCMGSSRATLTANIDYAMQSAGQFHRDQLTGQNDLFAEHMQPSTPQKIDYQLAPPWSPLLILQHEKKALGLYLSSHPVSIFEKELGNTDLTPLHHLDTRGLGNCSTYGLIHSIRIITTKRGKKMAIVTIENQQKRMDVTLFSELLETQRHTLKNDECLIVYGETSIDKFSNERRITAKTIRTFNQFRMDQVKRLNLTLTNPQKKTISQIKNVLKQHQNQRCPVNIIINLNGNQATFSLPKDFNILPTTLVLDKINQITSEIEPEFEYK